MDVREREKEEREKEREAAAAATATATAVSVSERLNDRGLHSPLLIHLQLTLCNCIVEIIHIGLNAKEESMMKRYE